MIKVWKLFSRGAGKRISSWTKINCDWDKRRYHTWDVISSDGLKADRNKIDALINMPLPTDKHGVQRYLGMVNYLQKFAPHLSDLTLPLRDFLKQDFEIVLEQAVHGECIKQIYEVLTTAPVLRYFDPKLQTVLQCDSCDTGLGACLMQTGQPVAYASRSLTLKGIVLSGRKSYWALSSAWENLRTTFMAAKF